MKDPVGVAGLCLARVDQWDINVFLVAELSDKRPLTAVTYTVFRVKSPDTSVFIFLIYVLLIF
jgi:hypothetical protein